MARFDVVFCLAGPALFTLGALLSSVVILAVALPVLFVAVANGLREQAA